ncbi:MAG TPA: AraC family transcriptional regulator [Thermoanaerobaculia bacterium]
MPESSQTRPGWDRFYGGLLLTRRRGAYDLSVLERLRQVCDLDAHPEEALDLEAMARAACFSKFHFLSLFRQAYGETPGRYLAQARLARARRLLEATERSATEVCFEVGYESGNFFSLTQP